MHSAWREHLDAGDQPRMVKCWAASKPKAKLEEMCIEIPKLGPMGIELKVQYCGLCGSDVHLINSDGGYADFTGWASGSEVQVCGHEAIGIITAVGSEVSNLKVGQRAGIGWQNGACHKCEWCLQGDEQLCSSVKATCCEGNVGAFASHIRIADAKFAFAIPDRCDSAATAPLLCGGQTVWTPLVQQTKDGDKVGILGLGGLGHMAIKFASALGRTVTALSSSDKKKDEAFALGAHAFVAHSDQEQLDSIAGSLDVIMVTLATTEPVDFAKFFPLLRPRGTMCFIGMCPPITADVFTMGFTMHNITTSNTGGRKEMEQMLDFCAENGIGASVLTRPMSQVNECLVELESAKHAKRFVLTNDDEAADVA